MFAHGKGAVILAILGTSAAWFAIDAPRRSPAAHRRLSSLNDAIADVEANIEAGIEEVLITTDDDTVAVLGEEFVDVADSIATPADDPPGADADTDAARDGVARSAIDAAEKSFATTEAMRARLLTAYSRLRSPTAPIAGLHRELRRCGVIPPQPPASFQVFLDYLTFGWFGGPSRDEDDARCRGATEWLRPARIFLAASFDGDAYNLRYRSLGQATDAVVVPRIDARELRISRSAAARGEEAVAVTSEKCMPTTSIRTIAQSDAAVGDGGTQLLVQSYFGAMPKLYGGDEFYAQSSGGAGVHVSDLGDGKYAITCASEGSIREIAMQFTCFCGARDVTSSRRSAAVAKGKRIKVFNLDPPLAPSPQLVACRTDEDDAAWDHRGETHFHSPFPLLITPSRQIAAVGDSLMEQFVGEFRKKCREPQAAYAREGAYKLCLRAPNNVVWADKVRFALTNRTVPQFMVHIRDIVKLRDVADGSILLINRYARARTLVAAALPLVLALGAVTHADVLRASFDLRAPPLFAVAAYGISSSSSSTPTQQHCSFS